MSSEHSESEQTDTPTGLFRPLDDQEQDWLDEHHKATFLDKVGRKGKVSGSAAEYARNTIIPEFFATWYPDSTPGEQEEMFATAKVKIYGHLINAKRPGAGTRRKKRAKSVRVDVTNLWADDNPAAKEKLLAKYRKENKLAANASIPVDVRRKLICEAFRKLPKDVRTEYEDRATELREERAKGKVLQGDERVEFAKSVPGLLKNFIREVEQQGVLITANVAYQVEETGTLEVTSVASKLLKDYKDTDGHADAVAAFVEWLRTQGKRVKRDIPVELSYPDRQNENMPLIPEIDYDSPPPVPVLRRVIRVYCSAINQRLGGSSHLTWTEIQLAQMKGDFTFIDRERMPPDYPLIDPKLMGREYALAWVKWLARPQKGEGDPRTWFIPRKVFTTSTNSLPTRDDAVSKHKVMRGGTEVWELTYTGWVERCQVNGNIKYPDDSRDYEELLKKRAQDSASRPHLQGLPCNANYVPAPAFSDEDMDFIQGLIQELPDTDKDTITGVLKATNEMYLQYPAETDNGVFDTSEGSLKLAIGLPSLLPAAQSKLSKPADFVSTWVPAASFAPPFKEVPASATIPFFEKWQYWALHKGYLKHPESDTLHGGLGGTRCVIMAILKLLFSIGAVLGKLQLPSPRPKDIHDPRVAESDWTRCLSWCREWQSSVEDSTAVLAKTFSERTHSVVSVEAPPRAAGTSTLSRKSRNDSSVEAGPSQLPEPPRTRPRPAYAPLNAGSAEGDPPSSSSDEGNRSDTYKQPAGDIESESDIEGEDEMSEDEVGTKLSKKAKGKQPMGKAQSKKRAPPTIEKSRDQYEADQGSVIPMTPAGPVPDVPLTSHPVGELLVPRNTPDWSGSVFQVVDQCRTIQKEVSGALAAWQGISMQAFRPEDKVLAITETMATTLSDDDKSALVLLAVQRKIWERTKDMWPTIQYQYRLFSELTRKLSRFFSLAHDLQKSAPAAILKNLKSRLVVLKRLSYQTRFVYQELHDLGMVSKEGFSTLPLSWCDSSAVDILGSHEIATVAERIREWSTKADQVVNYHAESRVKTWEHLGMDTKKHPVPPASWFTFGNPPSCAELDKVQAGLSARIIAAQDMDHESQDGQETDIDSVSPSEEERRAQALLGGDSDVHDGGEGQAGKSNHETSVSIESSKGNEEKGGGEETVASPTSDTAGDGKESGSRAKRSGNSATNTSTKAKPKAASKASSSKRRKSSPEPVDATVTEEPPKKRAATSKTKETQGGRQSTGGIEGQTTRSGRTVKVSARARMG